MAYRILVSAQGPLVLGFWVWGLGVWGLGLWGLGLTIGRLEPVVMTLIILPFEQKRCIFDGHEVES